MARAKVRIGSPEQLAAQILERFASRLPIDVEAVAKGLGCSVEFENMEPEVSGLLIRDRGTVLIAVNDKDAPVRKRFTIAHEIAHLLMHPGRKLLVDADVKINRRTPTAGFATEREETQANQFAAALLMPDHEVKALLAKRQKRRACRGSINKGAIKALATAFDVSESAMQYRLINLGLQLPH